MLVKKCSCILILCLCFSYSYSQEDTTGFHFQSELVHETYEQVNKLNELFLFDNLLNDTLISLPKVRAMVYMARAEKHWDFIYDELTIRSEEFIEEENQEEEDEELDYNIHLKSILNDYNSAINLCKECAVEYQFKRYEFLEQLNYFSETLSIEAEYVTVYKSDSSEMKSMGYREDRVGLGLGLNAIHGDDNWIGGELSVVSLLEPLNRLKYNSIIDGTTKRYWINKYPVEASWMTFGYNYSIAKEYNDFYFDLMNITSPVHFTFFKFGALQTDYSSKLLWYYRPEIGVGFGNVSIYYAYNAIFKKSMRDLSERHMFGLRIKLIPIKY